MAYKKQINSQGFTLVELSIVIIIIGFLIAGISAGQSLIKQAKINSIISEVTEYKAATNSFYGRYNYFPGDFPNTYAYWGALSGTTCSNNDVNVDITGCNGNGDGTLSSWQLEGILAWEQLSLAGLIRATYIVIQLQLL